MITSYLEQGTLIGEALVKRSLLTHDQRDQLLTIQGNEKEKRRLGEAAVAEGFISEVELAKFLAEYFHLPFVELSSEEEIDIAAIELIPERLARRYKMIAVKKGDQSLTLVMADPLDVRALDAARLETRMNIRKAVGTRTAINKAIDRSYHTAYRLTKSMDSLLADKAPAEDTLEICRTESSDSPTEQLRNEASDAPVIQFVNLFLMCAVQERASDVHVEPEENSVSVRFRIDGKLREMYSIPKHMCQGILTRIKILSNLNIAERRLPQDGRLKFRVFDKSIDVRVSCLPTIYGEKIVMRLLDRSGLILDMKALGFEQKMLDTFHKMLQLPHGLIVLTGPTGSGKTTTLYSALSTIKKPTINVVTIEDPVEYQLTKINQVHTKSDIGLTFAAGLRSILRQDPDVIMVGEIRDQETAEICIRAALTGHLVLSTLHTNDAVSAITRLTDMGIEPYLLSATLNLVMAQRLLRRLCPDCAVSWEPPAEVLERLIKTTDVKEGSWNFKKSVGCTRCSGTGYKGRVAVYEQFVITDRFKNLIAEGATLGKLKEVSEKEKIQTLFKSALNKAKEGLTTLDEVYSTCGTQNVILE